MYTVHYILDRLYSFGKDVGCFIPRKSLISKSCLKRNTGYAKLANCQSDKCVFALLPWAQNKRKERLYVFMLGGYVCIFKTYAWVIVPSLAGHKDRLRRCAMGIVEETRLQYVHVDSVSHGYCRSHWASNHKRIWPCEWVYEQDSCSQTCRDGPIVHPRVLSRVYMNST